MTETLFTLLIYFAWLFLTFGVMAFIADYLVPLFKRRRKMAEFTETCKRR